MKMRRLLLLMITTAVLLMFVACAEEPEAVPEYGTNAEHTDFNGAAFKYISESSKDSCLGYIYSTEFADLALQRLDEVEKKYNCTMDIEYGLNYGILSSSVLSGIYYADVIDGWQQSCISIMRAGGFSDLSLLLDVKNTDKWGKINHNMAMYWKDGLYGVIPVGWPLTTYGAMDFPITVNEDLVSTYGFTDPREYVENYEWTWDRFEQTLHDMTLDLGERTLYAFASSPPQFAEMFTRSNGGNVIDIGSNGEPIVGWYTAAMTDTIERMRIIYLENCKDCISPQNDNSIIIQNFIAGECVMTSVFNSSIFASSDSIGYKVPNYGVLPFPYASNANPETITYASACGGMTRNISITTASKEPEAVGIFLEALYAPFKGYETREDIVAYLNRNYFFDTRDTEVFLKSLDDWQYTFYPDGGRNVLDEVLRNVTTVEALEKYSDFYNTFLEEILIPAADGIEAVWGEFAIK